MVEATDNQSPPAVLRSLASLEETAAHLARYPYVANQQLGPKQLAWIEALESGKYRQTTGVLHNGSGYCCLGIACVSVGMLPAYACGETYRFGDSLFALPVEVAEEIAIRSVNGVRFDADGPTYVNDPALYENPHNSHTSLTHYNDTLAWTFAQIAAELRSDPSAYFREAR